MRFTILPYRQLSAAANMAVDAGMIALSRARSSVCFRYYGWTEAAITFGYSQQAGNIGNGMGDDQLARIRRETGGGIVDHRQDLTYALTLPRDHRGWAQPPAEIYRAVHRTLERSFREWGVAASLAPCPSACTPAEPTRIATECFARAEPGDVIETATGRKFAGAALRRHADALLLQGSISRTEELPMLDEPLWRRRFPALLAEIFDCAPPILAEHWPDDLPTPALVKRFASTAWNYKR